MKNLEIYCVTDRRLTLLENTKYKLCSVGQNFAHENYIKSSTANNIFFKEKYYSELTFHYWDWKNMFNIDNQNWIGFSQKRRHWLKLKSKNNVIDKKNLIDHLLFEPDPSWEKFDSIICEPIKVSGAKKIKILKRGWKNIIRDPLILLNEKKQTVKLHFDMHHGYGILDKAIDELNGLDREKFRNFVNSSNQYNPHIMFISKSKIINEWFLNLFEWLDKCEKIFGFNDLEGYDLQRLYAYLAERYLSYWFKNNTKFLEWPWTFVEV